MLRQGFRRGRRLQDAYVVARTAHTSTSNSPTSANGSFSAHLGSPQAPSGLFPAIRGLLVDAAGTLLIPSEPAAKVYLRYAAPHMNSPLPEHEVLQRFRA